MRKEEFSRIFKMAESEVDRLIELSRKAQKIGLSATPDIGLLFLTEMTVNCSGHYIFFVVDNMLYDQHQDSLISKDKHSPLGDQIFVPDWDDSYRWITELGWHLESVLLNENNIFKVTLEKEKNIATGQGTSGRVAMLEAAVQAAKK